MYRKVNPSKFQSYSKTSNLDASNLASISYELCRPIIVFGQILGLLSWDLTLHYLRESNYNFWKRSLATLYKLAATVAVIYITVTQAITYMEVKLPSLISAFAYKANKLMQMSFVSLILAFCLLEEQRFHRLLKYLKNTDILLQRTIRKRKFMMQCTVIQCVFSLELLVSWVIISALGTGSITEVSYYSVNLFFVTAFDLFVLVFFINVAHICAQSFSALSLELKDTMAHGSLVLYDYLIQLRIRYEKLYQLAESLQSTFSCIIAADLALQTVTMCLIAYMTLNISLEIRDIPFLLELLISTSRIYVIGAAADAVTLQARLGLKSLHDVHHKELTRREEFQVMILANKLSQYPIEISPAGGLFTLNKKTFTTILGTIVTYLIVLIQFLPSNTSGSKDVNGTAVNETH